MSRKRLKTAPFVASSRLTTLKKAHQRVTTPYYNYIVIFKPELNNQVIC